MTVIALPFPSFADRPMKVLCADLSDRIARVNGLRRVFRDLDIKVIRQDLIRPDPTAAARHVASVRRPLLVVDPKGFDLRRLAESLRLSGDTFTAVIGGVDVQWTHVVQPSLTH